MSSCRSTTRSSGTSWPRSSRGACRRLHEHACTVIGGDPPHGVRLDARCQYGADVDLFERDKILARAGELRGAPARGRARRAGFETEIRARSRCAERRPRAHRGPRWRLRVPGPRSPRLRDPPRGDRERVGLPRHQAARVPPVPADLHDRRDHDQRRLRRLLVRVRRRRADLVSRRARPARRAVRRRAGAALDALEEKTLARRLPIAR